MTKGEVIDSWIASHQNRHFCKCGCGAIIAIIRIHYWVGIPDFTKGHYQKFYAQQEELRFWKKVNKTDSCWIWTGTKIKSGYGIVKIKGKVTYAHRFSYMIHNRETIGDLCVCHKCDNPRCVRPDHLFLGTRTDNAQDKTLKGRAAMKLDASQVVQLVSDAKSGMSNRDMRAKYGVSKSNILQILNGRVWSWLTGIVRISGETNGRRN